MNLPGHLGELEARPPEDRHFWDVEDGPEPTIEQLESQEWRLNNLYYVMAEDGIKTPFRMNWAQKLLFHGMWYLNIILKARQLGFSTFVMIYMLDNAMWRENIRCGVIAHNRDDAEYLFRDKIKYAYDNLPASLRAFCAAETISKSELLFSNNSSIRVSTSFRGGTMQILHVCLSGKTEILTENAKTKRIEDIKPGDRVLTSTGGYQPVKALVKNRIEDIGHPLLSVKVSGCYDPLKITGNHSVMAREHKTGRPVWKQANELVEGDYMAFPVREPSHRVKELPIGDKKIKVDHDLGYFVGLYLAEGHIRKSELTFAGDSAEDAKRLEFIEQFSAHYNSVSVRHSSTSRTSSIVVNGWPLCNFIKEHFWDGDKLIPDKIWKWGRKFMDGLLLGYMDGDGCYLNSNQIQVTSIRRQLLDQVKMLLISLRYGYPSIYHRDAGTYYGRNCRETWVLKLYGAGNWKFRKHFGLDLPPVTTWAGRWRVAMGRNPDGRKLWRRGKDHYWARITSVDITEDEEFVYDIALEKDPHNYVTVSGVVHNSEFGKISRKYPEKAKEIVSGAFNAVHLGNKIFVESTAEGKDGEFHRMCMDAQKTQQQSKGLTQLDFKFWFFPWYKDYRYQIDPTNVVIFPRLLEYFRKLEHDEGIRLTKSQQAWYALKSRTMGELMWREFPATVKEAFDAKISGSYFAVQMEQLRKTGRIMRIPVDPIVPVDTWWDLGMNDSNGIWFTQTVGREIRVIRYYENSGYGLKHYVDYLAQLKEDFGYHYGRHVAPHDIEVRELGTGTTRLETALSLGIALEVCPKLPKTEQIEAARNIFARCVFDEENTEKGVDHLDNYRMEWDDKYGTWRDKPYHGPESDCADAFQILAVAHAFDAVQDTTPRAPRNWKCG